MLSRRPANTACSRQRLVKSLGAAAADAEALDVMKRLWSMNKRAKWFLIVRWTVAASVCTFALWIPLAAIAGSLRSEVGIASAPAAMFLYVLYSPFLAPLIVLATAPAYVALFWLWGRVCGRYPWVDAGWKSILAVAGAVSVPAALATAVLCSRGPLGVQYDDLFTWLPFCIAMFWGAIAFPRWLLDSLHPGAFSEPHYEVSRA